MATDGATHTRPPGGAHIGIVCCSAEGAALCYRTICTEGAALFGAHAHPEVTTHTPPFSDYMELIYRDDWRGVADLMLRSAEILARAGADFLICPDNTIHQALPHLLDRSPRPWIHIAECVADAARARGYSKLGITGTEWLVNSEVYPEKLSAAGIGYLRPPESDRREVNRIIMEELVAGVFSPESIAVFQRVIDDLRTNGCDAVVLGCTEIPLIISDENSSLPTLDSTRLLARAALARAALARAGNDR